jgi:hypothetical protein
MKPLLKKSIPHITAIVIFLIFAAAYFSPSFNDYSLKSHDVQTSLGMSKEVTDYALMNDDNTLWTNSMFSGMPAYQIALAGENNALGYFDRFLRLGLPLPVGMLFFMMVSFYIFALCLRINPWLSIVGALAFGFSTFNILYLGAGHITKIKAVTYLAPAVGGLILAFRGKIILGSAIFALFFGMNVYATHIQITYYLAILCVLIVIGESIRLIVEKKQMSIPRIAAGLLIASALAVLPSIAKLGITLKTSKYTTRGKSELTILPEGEKAENVKKEKKEGLDPNYILEYNYGGGELLSILSPNAKGERNDYIGNDEAIMENVDTKYAGQIAKMSRYWGAQRISGGAFYFGVIVLVLALFGLVFLKDALKWPFLVMTILALILAGNNPDGINGFFINKFPLYNKFRDSKMILVLLQLMIPALAIMFLDKLVKKEGLFGNKKTYLIASGVFILIGFILYASPTISGKFITNDEVNQFAQAADNAKQPGEPEYIEGLKYELIQTRKNIYKSDMGRTAFLIFLACGLVIVTAYAKVKETIIFLAAGVFVSFDNISVCKRYINNEDIGEGNRSWEDASKTALTYNPNISDLEILDQTSPTIPNFNSKVAELTTKMNEVPENELLSQFEIKKLAEFGTMNLNTDFRVLAMQNPFNESNTSYFHKSIGGYHGAKLMRYQEMVNFYIANEMQQINTEISNAKNAKLQVYASQMPITQELAQKVFDTIQVSEMNLSEKSPVLNMLNTRYIVLSPDQRPIRNENANGNAWFVSNVKKTNSANSEILAIKGMNSKTDVIVNEKDISENKISLKSNYPTDSSASIKLTSYKSKTLSFQSNAKQATPAVFSEIYFPDGWNFYVDGKLSNYFRANYVLRGAMIPAGQHKLEWKFEPVSFERGRVLETITSIFLLLLVFFVLGKDLMKSETETSNA